MFVKKWPLEYQKVIKTYLRTYLWDSSDSCDSSDRSDTSDSSDISDSNDSSDSSDISDSNDSNDSSDQTTLYTQKKLNLPKTYLPRYLSDISYCRESGDSSDSSDSSNSSNSSDSNVSRDQKNFVAKKLFPPENFFSSLKNLFTQKNHAPSSHKESCNLFTHKIKQSLKKTCNLSAKKSYYLQKNKWSNLSEWVRKITQTPQKKSCNLSTKKITQPLQKNSETSLKNKITKSL